MKDPALISANTEGEVVVFVIPGCVSREMDMWRAKGKEWNCGGKTHRKKGKRVLWTPLGRITLEEDNMKVSCVSEQSTVRK